MPTSIAPKPVSLEEAKRIQDCFGPCTTLGECWEPQDIVTTIAEKYRGNIRDFVRIQLECEEIRLERESSWLADEFPEAHAKAVKDAKTHLAAIKTRLREAGYKIQTKSGA